MNTKRHITVALSCLLLAFAGCEQQTNESQRAATSEEVATPEEAAARAAEAWLKLMADGDYARTWTEAASIFKSATTQQGWVQAVTPLRGQLGAVQSRELVRATHTTSVPGAPEGEYVILQYRTNFANRQGVAETITPMLDRDGVWRVSGYLIQ